MVADRRLVDWKSLPYEYASAHATPLLAGAMKDYLRISGDKAFVQTHWDALARAKPPTIYCVASPSSAPQATQSTTMRQCIANQPQGSLHNNFTLDTKLIP